MTVGNRGIQLLGQIASCWSRNRKYTIQGFGIIRVVTKADEGLKTIAKFIGRLDPETNTEENYILLVVGYDWGHC